ncbi:MAG: exodeoxyribonuclease VII small subunit [Planctomycetaceae bacterium]
MPATPNTETPTFEAALAELQRIVADLENGSVGLEESLARFERGVTLLKTCYATLEQAEHRIELLIGAKADGTPLTEPFDASATADAESPTAGRRRARKAKPETTAKSDADDESDASFLF